MKYAKLGNSDLLVSRICLGCMGFGDSARGQHSWTLDEEHSREIIRYALDQGINFFDTAISYQGGTSEQYVGRALREYAKREDIVVATKFIPRSEEERNAGITGQQHVLSQLDASLEHLGMEYVDLYIYHMWDWNTPVEEYLEGLHEAVKAGKVRALGIANCYAWQVAEANAIADRYGWTRFVSVQNHYNLIMREEEREMNIYCSQHNIALTPYSALAAGRLSKKPGETSKRLLEDAYAKLKYDRTAEEDRKIISRVEETAEKCHASMTEVALSWLLTKVTAPVAGATGISQIEGLVRAADLQLSDADISYLEELYVPHDLSGVMAQNRPSAASEAQVWMKNGSYLSAAKQK